MLSPSRGRLAAPPKPLVSPLRIALLLLPLLALLAPRDAHAYGWMLKHQYTSCGGCHTDPSGGELLTSYGRTMSAEGLSMKWGGSEGSARVRSSERRYAFDPTRFAAHAKLAEKDEETADEKVELEDGAAAEAKGEDAGAEEAEAKSAEGEGAEAPAEEAPAEEAAPAASAPTETPYDMTPFLFGAFTLPDWLLLGGSYRHMNIITPQSESKFTTFPMMMDLYGQVKFGDFIAGGSIGAARVAAGSPYARSAQITANQGKQFNLISRTHYVGYQVTDALSIKAGRLNLPFGVRLPEHIMWVRSATRTDRESAQQHGVSAYYLADAFRFELMGIAGNYQINPDHFRERGYSGYFEYFAGERTVVGVSSLVTVAKNDRLVVDGQKMTRQAHGGILRTAVGENTVISAEFDALVRSRFELGYVGMLQVDYEATQGLHFMATGEMLDEGHAKRAVDPVTGQPKPSEPRAPGSGKPRVGGWLSASWWFLPHFDVRLDALKRTGDDISILAQLHCYL
jgi:hypothetical protein